MLNRRNFLKRAFILAGGILVPTGLIKPSMANWWGHQGSGGGLASSYSAWNGKDQIGWGDQENVNIVQFKDPDATDDETSTGGGLSGADLVFTEAGGVVGSAVDGSGYTYRQVTNADDTFYTTDNYWELFSGNDWSIIIKLGDLQNHQGGFQNSIMGQVADPGNFEFQLAVNTNDKLNVILDNTVTTADSIVTTGNIWVCFWRRSGGNPKGGFVTTTGSGAHGQPTKESDFDAGKIVTSANAWSPSAPWTINSFFSYAGVEGITAKAYYIIGAKVCLIDA